MLSNSAHTKKSKRSEQQITRAVIERSEEREGRASACNLSESKGIIHGMVQVELIR